LIEEATAIELNEDYCSRCKLCCSVCPFEAVSFDPNMDRVSVDIEGCQLCGQCASTCPAHAIVLAYYDEKSLIEHIEEEMSTSGARNLVIMCRGSSPPSGEIWQILQEQDVKSHVPVRVPCVGRLSTEFYLQALSRGINKIITVQCDEKFCRFKRGSELNLRRVQLLKIMLEQLGYGKDKLVVIENPLQALYDTEKCVGCDKCEFICPYDAIEAQSLATPQIDYGLCKGCGACALVCPHSAIQLRGFEYEPLSQTIQEYKAEAERLRARGVSPIILVFCCQWAEFSALDNAKVNPVTENAMIVEIPCFNSLDPVHVLDALLSGFDGVLAVVCRDGDCKLEEGRGITEGNILALEGMLHKLNLKDKFEVFKTSPRYMGSFDSKLNSFISKISSSSALN
jgi:coenzyme F420-reducing hydrogenase delta subunit/formate hydrogenlyase subunit 6/NADH:ubiquinone oxidoreductase subunit I